MFSYRQTIYIFLEDRNCWRMQFFCSIFVTIVEQKSRLFYNIVYRCLKRIIFSFNTPAISFSSGWLITKECTFSSRICDNEICFLKFLQTKYFLWRKLSHKRQWLLHHQWMDNNFGLIRIPFPCSSSTGSSTRRFKSSGYHDWVLQTGAVIIRRGTHSFFTFRSTLGIILNAYGRPMFQFCIIAFVPWI